MIDSDNVLYNKVKYCKFLIYDKIKYMLEEFKNDIIKELDKIDRFYSRKNEYRKRDKFLGRWYLCKKGNKIRYILLGSIHSRKEPFNMSILLIKLIPK